MAKKTTKQPRLTLHQLIGAISFWGAATRLLLIGFVIAVIFALRVLYLETSDAREVMILIYVLSSYALLDIGYVILARAFPLKRRLDQLGLLSAEALLALTYVLPNLIHVPSLGRLATWSILIVLLVLGMRALLGMLFTKQK